MKHDILVHSDAIIIPGDNHDANSSNNLNNIFSEEKKRAQKEHASTYDAKLTAPFYDELHFANYE